MTPPGYKLQAPRRLFLLGFAAAGLLAGCSHEQRSAPQPIGPGPNSRNSVALLVPLTGEDAALGLALANSARLALSDMESPNISLTVFDTSEGGAASAASRAIAGGNRLILGPLLSDQVRAAAPIARSARVPMIAFSNDESTAGGGTYLLGFVPGQAIDRVVGHARMAGAVRFAALVPDSLYGARVSQGLLSSARRVGGQLVAIERYSSTETMRAAARRLASRSDLHAVLLGGDGRSAASVAPLFKLGVRLLGPDMWAGENNLGRTPRLRGAWYSAPSDARFGQFATRYRTRFRSSPPRLASLGYDAMLLTIRAARGWTAGRRFPASALGETEGFVGVDGVFRFNRLGVAQRGLEVRQVTAAGASVVSPAPSSF